MAFLLAKMVQKGLEEENVLGLYGKYARSRLEIFGWRCYDEFVSST